MKNKIGSIAVLCIVAVVIIYFLFGIVPSLLFVNNYTSEAVEEYTYCDSTAFTGIVFRKETVIETSEPFKMITYSVADGERVGKGTVVAEYSGTTFSAEDSRRLLFLNRNISILTKTLNSVITADASSLESDCTVGIADYLDACASGKMQDVNTTSANMQVCFNKRAVFYGSDYDYSDTLDGYLNEKSEIIAGYSDGDASVTSPEAGYFSSGYDGFESLTFDDAENLGVSEVEALISSEGKPYYSTYVGKVQLSPYWLFAGNLPASEVRDLEKGDRVSLNFNYDDGTDKTVSASVYSISSEEDGFVAVVFKCGVTTERELTLRKARCELIHSSYNGLKVSTSALRVEDGEDGVYALIGQKLVFKPVNIVYFGDSFSIVKAAADSDARRLTVNDDVICGGKDMFDGKIVDAE